MKPRNILLTASALAMTAAIAFAPEAHARKEKEELLKAGDAAAIGEAIALELDSRDLGYESQISTMEMILRDAHGGENRREMESRQLERPALDVGDKSLLVFYTPSDLNGTAFLSFAEILTPDDQWLYLPSIKRVKRISSKNKSGPFVGSEFAYEDITGNEVGKYSWTYEGTEDCPVMEGECFKLTSVPKYEHSGYTKRIVWVDTKELRADKIDFYDRKDSLIKTQTFNDYHLHLDKHWRADRWEMKNLQTDKSTTLLFKDYKFKSGLTDADFTTAGLRRVR